MINAHLPRSFVLFLYVFVLGCFLSGCSQQPVKDVVAEVNGVPIYFYEMNAYRDMLFQGLTADGLPPNDETLRQQYGYALTCIIEQEIIRQYLQRKKIHVDESQTVKEEALVQGDYSSPEEFQEALIENGISLDLWHQMMRRRQDVLTFTTHVLRPKVTLTSEEIEAYYTTHQDEFHVSEQFDFLYIESSDKEKVAKARELFIETRDASLARIDSTVYVRDVRLSSDRLPESTVKDIVGLSPYTATTIRKIGENHYTYVLRKKIPAGLLDVGQTFKRIEQILVERQVQILLDAWLQREYAKATIKVLSPLLDEVVVPVDKKLFAPEAGMKDAFQDEELDEDNGEDALYDVDFFSPLDVPGEENDSQVAGPDAGTQDE